MTWRWTGIGLALALAGTAALAQPASLERRPGWWRLDLTAEAGGARPTHQQLLICTDPAIDKLQTPSGIHMSGGCPPPDTVRAADGWRVTATCKAPTMTFSADAHVVGDLASAYRSTVSVHMDPPVTPSLATVSVVIDARRLGDCPAGKKPGDMDMTMSTSVAPKP